MNGWSVLRGGLVACALMGLTAGQIQAQEKAPFRFGNGMPTSGTQALFGGDQVKAQQWAVDDINKAGGINGRKLEMVLVDTQADPQLGINAVNRFIGVDKVPMFLRNKGLGWVTAEYAMLPRATNTRTQRETQRGPSGRTQEIQRLIGRSLRAIVDTKLLGERQIYIDCDVIQADGGTRCASITGAYVALALACRRLMSGPFGVGRDVRGDLGAADLVNGAAVQSYVVHIKRRKYG